MFELLARDPRKVSDDEFKALVEELRAQRHKFVLGAGSAPKKTSTLTERQAKLEL